MPPAPNYAATPAEPKASAWMVSANVLSLVLRAFPLPFVMLAAIYGLASLGEGVADWEQVPEDQVFGLTAASIIGVLSLLGHFITTVTRRFNAMLVTAIVLAVVDLGVVIAFVAWARDFDLTLLAGLGVVFLLQLGLVGWIIAAKRAAS